MLITPRTPPFTLPEDFESCDMVSINFRHFLTWLNEQKAAEVKGFISEIRFPWTHEARMANRRNRLNGFAQKSIGMLNQLSDVLDAARCTVILSEAAKQHCAVAVSSPLPHMILQSVQNMPCPDEFAVPSVINFELNAQEYLSMRVKELKLP